MDTSEPDPALPSSGDVPDRTAFFAELAGCIIKNIGPASVLDFGSLRGSLVKSLRDNGVEAFGLAFPRNSGVGVEVSPEMPPFFQRGSLLEPLPRSYDLIVCLDVFEQLSPTEAERVVQNFAAACDDILFSSNPTGFFDPRHRNVQEPPYWAALFARYGFQHELEFDASFVNGWAMRFRKTDKALEAFVLTYERQFWKANRQLEVLRDLFKVRPSAVSKGAGGAETFLPQLQSFQTELPSPGQNSPGVEGESEPEKIRPLLGQAEQEILRQQQRAERTLQLFKMAQARFRQMEKERDLQILAVEQNRVEAEQQLAYLRQQLEQAEQELKQYQGQVYQLEDKLQNLKTNRVGQAANLLTRLGRTSLHLVKHSLSGRIEGSMDKPVSDSESFVEGTLHLAGWAYSGASHINEVQVFLDDKFLGHVKYGLPRPDVIKIRPWQPVLNCGFETKLKLDPGIFPPGAYTLSVKVKDLKGNSQKFVCPVRVK